MPCEETRSTLTETSGPTELGVGDVAEGQTLVRRGDQIVGETRVNLAPVRLATTGALPAHTLAGITVLEANANGALTIDMVAVAVGNRLLLKDEGGVKDGIYVVTVAGSAGTKWKLTRAQDADEDGDIRAGTQVYVSDGTANHHKQFRQGNLDPIVIGTSGQSWEEHGGAGGGDMVQADYDSDADFIVNDADHAALADVADAVSAGAVDLAGLDSAAAKVQWGVWMGRSNPAANTNAQLVSFPQAGSTLVFPVAAQLVAITAMFTGTFTTGQAIFRIKKNGSADTGIELTVASPNVKGNTTTGTGASFAAGDYLGAEMDTSATYNGTTGQWNIFLLFKADRV